MSGLEGFSWTEYVRRPALVLNDGQAALLGEVWQGAARGVQNAFMLTLGTGVGGAIYAGGHLLKGHIGRGGHLGHFCLNPDGPPDDSGMPGSLELAIGDLSVSTRSQGRFSSTKDLVNQVIAGDDIASQIWNRSVQQLACAIASLINALDPEIVLIGGGIANAGKILYEPLDKFLGKIEWRPHGHRVPVVSSQLGEWSGAMGAAYHALRNGDT
jgi:glucokinase